MSGAGSNISLHKSTIEQLNVTVEWLALLLRIWEVTASNLGLETG
jgi:hypothetical protein